jgi:hypothetical protein
MAILYITEFREWGEIGGSVALPRVPPVTIQQLTVSRGAMTCHARSLFYFIAAKVSARGRLLTLIEPMRG